MLAEGLDASDLSAAAFDGGASSPPPSALDAKTVQSEGVESTQLPLTLSTALASTDAVIVDPSDRTAVSPVSDFADAVLCEDTAGFVTQPSPKVV